MIVVNRGRVSLLAVVTIAASLGIPLIAKAADAAADQGSGDQGPKLQEVVVTAQKRAERLQDVPTSISVLGGTDLDQSTFVDAFQALNTVPGVTAFGYGSTSIVVRGVPSPGIGGLGQGSPTIGYYLDGVPFGLIKSGSSPDLNVYDLQRIEILKGPQGTLYGASALNGVIQILTNDPTLGNFDVKGRAFGSYTDGGGGNYGGDLAINAPIVDGKVGARLVAGYQYFSGWIDSPVKNNINDEEHSNIRLKVEGQPTDNLVVVGSAWHDRQLFGLFNNAANDEGRVNSLINQPGDVEFNTYGLRVGYKFTGASLVSQTSFLDYSIYNHQDLVPLLSALGIPGISAATAYSRSDSHVFSEEMLLNSEGERNWRWSLGAFYRRGTEEIFQSIPIFGVSDGGFDVSKSIALFGELTRLLWDGRVEVTGGVRYFHDDVFQAGAYLGQPIILPLDDTFHKVTPRALVAWHPTHESTIYASYSEGFRSGAPQNPAVAAAGIPPVGPDDLRNYELGAKASTLDGRLSFDLAVYYMKWLDIQQSHNIVINGLPQNAFINGTSASGVGVDFGITAKPTENIALALGYSWNNLSQDEPIYVGSQVFYNKGDRLANAPGRDGHVSAEYSIPLADAVVGRLAASATYTGYSWFRDPGFGSVYVPYHSNPMLDARVSFTLDVRDRFSIKLFVDNLTNDQGTPARSSLIPEYDLRVRPRTGGLQLEYHPY